MALPLIVFAIVFR